MAADFQGIAFEGGKELDEALRRLAPNVAVRHLRAAVRAGLSPIRKQARVNLRVFGRRSGRLRQAQSLKIRTITVRASGGDVQAALTNSRATYYGRFLEFGTRHITGRRWMTRAMDAMKHAALEAVATRIWAGVEREAARLRAAGMTR